MGRVQSFEKTNGFLDSMVEGIFAYVFWIIKFYDIGGGKIAEKLQINLFREVAN